LKLFPPICAHCGREFSGKIVLETGTRLAVAIKLYERCGMRASRSLVSTSRRRPRAGVSANHSRE
jgi:hypothetical protein